MLWINLWIVGVLLIVMQILMIRQLNGLAVIMLTLVHCAEPEFRIQYAKCCLSAFENN